MGIDSPAAKYADQERKLRDEIIKTARETVKAACSSLIDRLIENNCQGSIPEVREFRKDALLHVLKHVSLHDILVKKDI